MHKHDERRVGLRGRWHIRRACIRRIQSRCDTGRAFGRSRLALNKKEWLCQRGNVRRSGRYRKRQEVSGLLNGRARKQHSRFQFLNRRSRQTPPVRASLRPTCAPATRRTIFVPPEQRQLSTPNVPRPAPSPAINTLFSLIHHLEIRRQEATRIVKFS
jgi:hypothetical protein